MDAKKLFDKLSLDAQKGIYERIKMAYVQESVTDTFNRNNIQGSISTFYGFRDKLFITVKKGNMETFGKLLEMYTPTKMNFNCGNDNIFVESPFKIDLKNPAVRTKNSQFEITVKWVSDDHEIWYTVPIDQIKDYVKISERKIYNSEYVHFQGVSATELSKMRTQCYKFKDKNIQWYGGDSTLLDEKTINDITADLINN